MDTRLGDRLRSIRTSRGLGMCACAKKAGISNTYMSRLERSLDPSPPTEATLREFARLYDCDLDELLCLAKRVPSDVASIIAADVGMASFLRAARAKGLDSRALHCLLESSNSGQ
jgi:HTH-type transcriptional regulator, competence development regulator